jgi:hypothetical protein
MPLNTSAINDGFSNAVGTWSGGTLPASNRAVKIPANVTCLLTSSMACSAITCSGVIGIHGQGVKTLTVGSQVMKFVSVGEVQGRPTGVAVNGSN